MNWWTKIRLEVLRGETSKREILRREGIHWETLKKILENSEPPGYRIEILRPKPKIGPYLDQIAQIIEDDKQLPKKQRHTAKRIYQRIGEMGYEGKYTQVKEAIRETKRLKKEVYMPLNHKPGEAQVDFGYALAKVSGISHKLIKNQRPANPHIHLPAVKHQLILPFFHHRIFLYYIPHTFPGLFYTDQDRREHHF